MRMIPPGDQAWLAEAMKSPETLLAFVNDLIRDTNDANAIALAAGRGALAQEADLIRLQFRTGDLLSANNREVERRRSAERHVRALVASIRPAYQTPEFREAAKAALDSLNQGEGSEKAD